MIADKRGLAAKIVGTGEQWLTELSTGQLRRPVPARGRGGGRVSGLADRSADAAARGRGRAEGAHAPAARSARSWWSRRFLDVLESFAMGSRLTRGRNYARRGQVISLEVGPARCGPRCRARGPAVRRRDRSAAVHELVWAKAEIALAEQALPSAKLLAGEMPPELEEIFAAAGAPLFPRTVDELDQRCSCPDWRGAVQAPGGDLLPAGRGVRRRPVPDLALARPGPRGAARPTA